MEIYLVYESSAENKFDDCVIAAFEKETDAREFQTYWKVRNRENFYFVVQMKLRKEWR